MPFMFLIFAFLLGAVLWGFFHANPRGVAMGRLLACNIVILLGAATAGLGSALPLMPMPSPGIPKAGSWLCTSP